MAMKYEPLTLGMLEEGETLLDLQREFFEAHKEISSYAQKYAEAAQGAKAKLTFSVEFKVRNPGSASSAGVVDVTTSIGRTAPRRPAAVTSAMIAEADSAGMCLFSRSSGSTEGDPAQGVLATRHGKVIDMETGEVKQAKGER